MYVTAEQFADVLPSPLLANRFVIMSFGYDADQASLHWNDMDYWSDEAAETAITDGDEDGCYWTGLHVGRGRLSGPVGDARHGGVRPSRRQNHLGTRRISMHVRAYPLIPFL